MKRQSNSTQTERRRTTAGSHYAVAGVFSRAKVVVIIGSCAADFTIATLRPREHPFSSDSAFVFFRVRKLQGSGLSKRTSKCRANELSAAETNAGAKGVSLRAQVVNDEG
ncbi:hypothetical protein MRX96_039467 [Rhipicephalus microplus]